MAAQNSQMRGNCHKLSENIQLTNTMGHDIAGNLDELDRVRDEQAEILIKIDNIHEKLRTTPEVVERPGDNSLSRLKNLYKHAMFLSEREVSISEALIDQLDALIPSEPGHQERMIEGNGHKKETIRANTHCPKVAVVGDHLSNPANLQGKEVAARVTPGKEEWYIVKVIRFDMKTREFEVLDEVPGDDEEPGSQRIYKVPMSLIIRLPKRDDPSTAIELPPGARVLAVYPETTTLYKATVVKRKAGKYNYVLEFDGEEDRTSPYRVVPYYNVVTLPEGHH